MLADSPHRRHNTKALNENDNIVKNLNEERNEMSQFDADAFLNQEVDANFVSEYTPIPEGEFEAQVSKVAVASFKDKETGEEKPFLKLSWRINDPEVVEATGMEKPTVMQTVFLDFENGALLEGTNKNVMLGKLRELGGLEANPFRMTDLEGVSAMVKVKHRIMDDGRPAADVKAITEI